MDSEQRTDNACQLQAIVRNAKAGLTHVNRRFGTVPTLLSLPNTHDGRHIGYLFRRPGGQPRRHLKPSTPHEVHPPLCDQNQQRPAGPRTITHPLSPAERARSPTIRSRSPAPTSTRCERMHDRTTTTQRNRSERRPTWIMTTTYIVAARVPAGATN